MNKIEKGKAGLSVLSVVLMIVAVLAIALAVFLIIFGANLCANGELDILFGVLSIVGGSVIAILGLVFFAWTFWFFVLGRSIKATKGTISEENLAKMEGNTQKCPSCGATNTIDATNCTVCKTPLK